MNMQLLRWVYVVRWRSHLDHGCQVQWFTIPPHAKAQSHKIGLVAPGWLPASRLVRLGDGLGSIVDAELLQKVVHAPPGSGDGDHQLCGDLPVGFAGDGPVEDSSAWWKAEQVSTA